jgi:DUF971 family protein
MNVPQEIATDATQRLLTLRWTDGRAQRIAYAQLREACACAECRRLRHDGGSVSAPLDVSLIDMQTMGYGVQIVFSDGHARGIYPWRYLEQLAEAK